MGIRKNIASVIAIIVSVFLILAGLVFVIYALELSRIPFSTSLNFLSNMYSTFLYLFIGLLLLFFGILLIMLVFSIPKS